MLALSGPAVLEQVFSCWGLQVNTVLYVQALVTLFAT